MRIISKSILKSIRIFILKRELQMKIFGIWMKLDFARALAKYIRL